MHSDRESRRNLSAARRPKRDRLVVEDIMGRIARGELKPGDRLPGLAQLCRRYAVSSIVVLGALRWLQAEALIDVVPGDGMFVADGVEWPEGTAT